MFEGTSGVGVGVQVGGADGNIIVSNFFTSLSEHGVRIVSGSDNMVSGNRFNAGIASFDGILIEGNSDRNLITGNRIVGSGGRFAINVSASTVDNTRIGFNQVGVDADYGTGAINDAGTGTRRVTAEPHLFNSGGTLSVGTGLSEVPMIQPGRVVGVRARVSTAPTDADIIVDVDKNNVTMYTTQGNRPTITAAAKDSGNATFPDITEFVAGDFLSINIDQIGSTIAGADLVVQVLVEYI